MPNTNEKLTSRIQLAEALRKYLLPYKLQTLDRKDDLSNGRLWHDPNKWLNIKLKNIKFILDGMPGTLTPLTPSTLVPYYLSTAQSALEHQVYDCTAASALVLKYMLDNKIPDSITLLQFELGSGDFNCNHQFVAIGLKQDQFSGEKFNEILKLPPAQWGKDVIIIDLWNKEKPFYKAAEFTLHMRELLETQPDILINHSRLEDLYKAHFLVAFHAENAAAVQYRTWRPRSNADYLTQLGIFTAKASLAIAAGAYYLMSKTQTEAEATTPKIHNL